MLTLVTNPFDLQRPMNIWPRLMLPQMQFGVAYLIGLFCLKNY
jgi:hypothetical protein